MLDRLGVALEVTGQLLTTVGDNPERMRSEAAFAHLCGVAPIPASSGKTRRYRLNRGGDRAANNAIYTVVLTRLRLDERTRAYYRRRTAEGLSKREIIRCLQRYVARELYQLLVRLPLSSAPLRDARQGRGTSVAALDAT
jgi:transposase